MPGSYAYTPYIWPSLFTILLLLVLSVYALRRHSVPGALPFAVGALFAALWVFGSLMEVVAMEVTTKILWLKFQAVWQLPAVTSITCFVLEYTWPGRWLSRRNLFLLSLVPLFYFALLVTSDFHQLAWRGFIFDSTLIPRRGPATRFVIAYGYGLGIVNLLLFGWLFLRSPPQRWPVAIMLTGQVSARVLYLIDASGSIRSSLPLDVPMMALLFVIYAVVLFGLHIFSPVPLAQQMAVAQMRDGMIVLDPEGRVASLNPAARAILGMPEGQILGRPLALFLPGCTAALAGPEAVGVAGTEVCLGKGAEANYYALERSPLKDWRGLDVGQLLLLRNVTEDKQAQEELIGQQRTLATLRERERLARELHDSLGQTLASAHLRASTARVLLARGETAQTDNCLEEMAKITMAAETDVREYLLGAKTVFSADLPFFPALSQYVERFSRQYGLPVTLHVPTDLEREGLEPAVEVQVMRIIQEALSNVRKHAAASSVQIGFADLGEWLQVTVRDDGRGFIPEAVAEAAEGYGLRAMRERAEELGGRFRLRSRPGQGTDVVVQVPRKWERLAVKSESEQWRKGRRV